MSVNGISCNSSSAGIDLARLEPKAPAVARSTDSAAAAPGLARDQFRGDIKALFAAVKAGDMTAAQDALTALQTDRAARGEHGRRVGYDKSPVKREFAALIEAVRSGDASAAQDALAKLQQDLLERGRIHNDRPDRPLPVDPGVNPPEPGRVHIDRNGDGDSR